MGRRKPFLMIFSMVCILSILLPMYSANAITRPDLIDITKDITKIDLIEDVIPKGKLRWEFNKPALEGFRTSPAIGMDGTVYVGDGTKRIYALDHKGNKKWELKLDDNANTIVTGPEGMIYVGTYLNFLYAINPDGSIEWKSSDIPNVIPGKYAGGGIYPAVGPGGMIYASSTYKNVYAINKDGTPSWEFPTGGFTLLPLIGADGTIYAVSASTNKALYAIKPDGEQRWEFALNGLISAPTIDKDGIIYIGADRTLYAIDPGGKQKWAYVLANDYVFSPASSPNGTVYIRTPFDKKLYAISEGKKIWEFTADGKFSVDPAVDADGTIYVGFGSKLYALHSSGTIKWEFDTKDYLGELVSGSLKPAFGSDGTVYISTPSKVLAIGMVSIDEISLNKTELTLKSGQSETLQATVSPANATYPEITWSSSDTTIATVDNNGKVTGIAPGIVKISATSEEGYYKQCTVTVIASDISPTPGDSVLTDIDGHWAKDKIIQAVGKDIVNGYPDKTFKPDRTVTRAEFSVMLTNALKPSVSGAKLTFKDKASIGSWATDAVSQCVELGIIKGYTDGTFRPNKTITHSEMISMLVNAANLPINDDSKTSYADDAKIPAWAKGAAATAELNGIPGFVTDNKFGPNALSTRAESVTSILNMLDVKL